MLSFSQRNKGNFMHSIRSALLAGTIGAERNVFGTVTYRF